MRTRIGVHGLAGMIALLLVALSRSATAGADDGVDHDVSVREHSGVYTVAARFQVPQAPAVAVAVLTDYEQVPRFMPDVKTSIVRGRFPGGVIVEQEAVARVMMFSRRVHLMLEVRIDPDVIRFRDSCRRSFMKYEGAWRLAQVDGRTEITYELAARPNFDVPQFLLTRLLKRDARQMIDRLRGEMAARLR